MGKQSKGSILPVPVMTPAIIRLRRSTLSFAASFGSLTATTAAASPGADAVVVVEAEAVGSEPGDPPLGARWIHGNEGRFSFAGSISLPFFGAADVQGREVRVAIVLLSSCMRRHFFWRACSSWTCFRKRV